MIGPHESCPRAHLPPERLAVLGLLIPLFCGAGVCGFIYLPSPLACLASFVLLVGVKALATARWEGFEGVWLQFVAVDARTTESIPGAKVALYVAPSAREPWQEACTSPEGTATLTVYCWVRVKRWLFLARCSAFFADWQFRVTAAGYGETARELLASHAIWAKGVQTLDPLPIRVELKRLPGPAVGE